MFTTVKQKKISLGEFQLEPEKRLLTLNGESVHLSNRPFQVLLYLMENRERVVSRKELLDKFWDGHEVYEVALSKCVGAIRKALGDRLDEPRFIETRWAEGYRFIYELEKQQETPESFVIENGGQDETNLTAGETVEPNKLNDNTSDALRANDPAELSEHFAVAEKTSDLSTVQPKRQTNIAWKKRRLFVILLMGLLVISIPAAIWLRSRSNRAGNQPVMIRSIAVIPIKNLTGDSEQEYLADGITEGLIASLSKIEGMKVSSRGSVFSFKNKEADPKQVGEKLGVETLLEGSMQRNGESLRVEVRLVSTKDGSVLWSGETHERSIKNIISLQDELARSVVTKLGGGQPPTHVARRYTENEEAYKLYQKGRFFWNKRTGQGFNKAIEYFNQAIALDPNYALAFAGLADCYMLISPYGIGKPQENFPKAKEFAEKALGIDPDLAEVHASLGHLEYLYEWNWAKAEENFKRAIKLNPNSELAHQWYANFLSSMGRNEEALSLIKRARELDPFSVAISTDVARVYYHAKDYDHAIEQWLKMLELDSNLSSYNSWLDMAYAQKGLYEKAIEQRLLFFAYRKVEEEKIAALKKAFKENGWAGYCREELNQSLQRVRQGDYVLSYNMARSYARLSEKEQTLEWLEKAYAEHSDHLVLLKVDPLFDFMRQDSRFQDLMRRIGFN